MEDDQKHTITVLLRQVEDGVAGAEDQLFELVYADLHREAVGFVARQPGTLEGTDLVHEVYAKMFGRGGGRWESRRHFLGVAAKAMRSILVDHARARSRAKRSPDGPRVALDSLVERFEERIIDVLDLDDALNALAAEDPHAAHVVELRHFGGLSLPDIASVLGVPLRTVEREWSFARIRLRRRLG